MFRRSHQKFAILLVVSIDHFAVVTPFVPPEIRLKSDSSSPKHFDFLATSITLEGGFT